MVGTTNLISKIAAGGLSAGVFLIWWPGHIDGDGLGQLVLRGLLWTLSFELLLLAFSPLERLIADALKGRIAVRRRERAVRLRTGGAVALASIGLAVPALLLTDPGAPPPEEPKREVKVVKEVVVKRPVIKREVVVRPEVVSPAPTPAPAPEPRTIVKRVEVPRAAPKTNAKQEPQPEPAPQPAGDLTDSTNPRTSPAGSE